MYVYIAGFHIAETRDPIWSFIFLFQRNRNPIETIPIPLFLGLIICAYFVEIENLVLHQCLIEVHAPLSVYQFFAALSHDTAPFSTATCTSLLCISIGLHIQVEKSLFKTKKLNNRQICINANLL
ncbi:hypothetical protein ACJX0J_037478, partial [Zea mays]